MQHHALANIDAYVGNPIRIISAYKEHQVAGVGRGGRRADVAKALSSESANVPARMIDDPAYETGTVKAR